MAPDTTEHALLRFQLARLAFLRDAAAALRLTASVAYFHDEYTAVEAKIAAYKARYPMDPQS